MVSLLFILSLAATIFFVKKSISSYIERSKEDFYKIASIVSGVISAFLCIYVAVLIVTVGTGHTIDAKISMYEAENAIIEESIDATVKNYMSFEKETYSELKDKDSMDLVSLFPELKSDELVQEQISTYTENRTQIKRLKNERIDLSKARFELYFGR